MKKIFVLVSVLALLSVMSYAAGPVLTGSLTDYAFLAANNHSLGADTNGNEGFGVSDYQTRLYGYDDPSTLYVFIQGTLGYGNQLWLFIDSDDNAATGVSGQPPTGTLGPTNAAATFSQVANGGWDTLISIESDNGSDAPPTGYEAWVITYTSAGALGSETFLGDSSGALVAQYPATINSTPGNFYYGCNSGDTVPTAGLGLDIAIPRAWLGYASGHANYRLAVAGGNSTDSLSEYWSNSFIPPLAPGAGNVGQNGNTAGSITAFAGLTAPVFSYLTQVPHWDLYK